MKEKEATLEMREIKAAELTVAGINLRQAVVVILLAAVTAAIPQAITMFHINNVVQERPALEAIADGTCNALAILVKDEEPELRALVADTCGSLLGDAPVGGGS